MSGSKSGEEKVQTIQSELNKSQQEDAYMKNNWENYMKMKFYQFQAQNALMDNFQILFLKKYDMLLTKQEKQTRTYCDYFVQSTSTIANLGSFFFILSQLSITQQVKFNPIRDCKVLLGGIAFMLAMRGAGILVMWSQMEDIFFRIKPNINYNEKIDFYANNVNNNLKIFLYRNFY